MDPSIGVKRAGEPALGKDRKGLVKNDVARDV